MITRRRFATSWLCASIAELALPASPRRAFAQENASAVRRTTLTRRLAQIEARTGGRLGVAVDDERNDLPWGRRQDERFPMCSTSKLLVVGAVLTRCDAGHDTLARRVAYSKADLLSYSPLTRARMDEGMTVGELCGAAITVSDNAAANLLIATLGGPPGVTAFARRLGDPMTRLDRTEPTLNEARPGDPRDTTTPAAMASVLRRLVLGDALSASSRVQLIAWLTASQTGGARLRAKLPADWRVGDKTGTGDNGTANDVAIVWPPGRAPLIMAVYLTGATVDAAQRDAALADVGAAVADAL